MMKMNFHGSREKGYPSGTIIWFQLSYPLAQ
jgi:hypothetical protein